MLMLLINNNSIELNNRLVVPEGWNASGGVEVAHKGGWWNKILGSRARLKEMHMVMLINGVNEVATKRGYRRSDRRGVSK